MRRPRPVPLHAVPLSSAPPARPTRRHCLPSAFWLITMLALPVSPGAARATPTAQSPATPAVSIVRIDAQDLKVPPPPGFRELPAGMSQLKRSLEQSAPAEHRLLAVYVTDEDLALMRQGKPVELSRSATLQTPRAWEARWPQPADLARLREEARRTLEPQRAQNVASAANEHLAQTLRPSGPAELAPRLQRLKFQGLFDEGETSFSMLMLSDYAAAGSTSQIAAASTFALLRGKLVLLHVHSALRTPSDIEWVRSVSRRWHASLVRDNL